MNDPQKEIKAESQIQAGNGNDNGTSPKTRTPLFRAQAIAHKRRNLYGDVILSANPALWGVTIALFLAACAIISFAFIAPLFGSGPDIGALTFWQWLSQGSR